MPTFLLPWVNTVRNAKPEVTCNHLKGLYERVREGNSAPFVCLVVNCTTTKLLYQLIIDNELTFNTLFKN
ncbi:MAG: hypothetical protein KDK65_06095 [Chlamydiia bacterium]|nr:hypothetical protein [Chlamydiia bacterium]